jgi:carbon storage regulator
MLILARKTNERIIIGEDIEVSVVDIKGDQVKLGIQAPDDVKVYRQEVFQAIQEENRTAAMTSNRDLPQLSGLSGAAAKSGTAESSPQGAPSGTGAGPGTGADTEPDPPAEGGSTDKPSHGRSADKPSDGGSPETPSEGGSGKE